MRFLTAGESHGPCLIGIIEGLPSNLPLDIQELNRQLSRRQQGYGRGKRMQIERDRVKILSGMRHGRTLGSPLGLVIDNRDWENWQDIMSPEERGGVSFQRLTCPRPGHADLAGGIKYGHKDLRNVLERASARETAMRVAIGSVARQMLALFGVEIFSHVVVLGGIRSQVDNMTYADIRERAEQSPVRCADPRAEREMIAEIEAARESGDSVGGIFEVIATGVPVGLGSHVHWDRRLDGCLARGLMSLQAIKGVEIGIGFEAASRRGSRVHDPITYIPERGYSHLTNRAGGIEGGVTNGEPIIVRAVMKPIPTLTNPLPSIDLVTKEKVTASVERADVCAVPAASVVSEAIVGWELAVAFREKFGGDSVEEMQASFNAYQEMVQNYPPE